MSLTVEGYKRAIMKAEMNNPEGGWNMNIVIQKYYYAIAHGQDDRFFKAVAEISQLPGNYYFQIMVNAELKRKRPANE